jgi:hypothetical protein
MGAQMFTDPPPRRIPRLRYLRRFTCTIALGTLVAFDLGPTGFMSGSWSIAVPQAFAHDNWIARGPYRSPRDGKHCCGENDCFPVHVDDVTITPQGYWLSSGEQVPFEEALLSEDGSYWHCMNPDRSRRCFFAPRGGV